MLLSDYQNKCRQLLTEEIIPFWSEFGFDNDLGFVEQLSVTTLQPDWQTPRRLLCQMRQIWSFALAQQMHVADTLKLALKGFQLVEENYFAQQAYYFTIGKEQQKSTDYQDCYSIAFFILTMSKLYEVTNNPAYLNKAESMWQLLTEEFKADIGFFSSTKKEMLQEQNPHMHLFEALLAITKATNSNVWRARTEELFFIAVNYLYDNEDNCIYELHTHGLGNGKATGVEPGHQMEWVWLLWNYEKLFNKNIAWIDKLYATASLGVIKQGRLSDAIDLQTKATKDTAKLWIQTEAMKAHIAQYRRKKDDKYLEHLIDSFLDITENYLYKGKGFWREILTIDDKDISSRVPATSLYHIILAFDEFINLQ